MTAQKNHWSRFESWVSEPRERAIGMLVTLVTLLILGIQTLILVRQTNIMDRQTATSIRPEITTEVMPENESSPDRTGPWVIRNVGGYPVKNLHIKVLHFERFDKGWMFSSPSTAAAWTRTELKAEDEWTVDISVLAPLFRDRKHGNLVRTGHEFIDLLLSFERAADGKQYIFLEPFYVFDGKPIARSSFVGFSGPLARTCAPEVELFFEYFKRHPYAGFPEIYNATYLAGYVPTGCLGEIKWITETDSQGPAASKGR